MTQKSYKLKQVYWRLKEWFAFQPDYFQIAILIIAGILTVSVAGLFYSSIHDAYLVFINPPSLIDYSHNYIFFLFSLMIMLVGLVLAGYVISILTNSLANVIKDVKLGNVPYYGKGHILIINYSNLLRQICKQLNNITYLYKIDSLVILVDNHNLVRKINDLINSIHLDNIKIHVRFGDVLEYDTYRRMSITQIKSLLILPDIEQKDEFLKDNKTLKIFYTLIQEKEFFNYITEKQGEKEPVKALAITKDTLSVNNLITRRSNNLILSLYPDNIFSSLISISIVDLDFYYLWNRLLSIDDYNIIFVDARKLLPENVNDFDEIVLLQEEGITIGFCSFKDNIFSVTLGPIHKKKRNDDWLIVLARSKQHIRFSTNNIYEIYCDDIDCFIPQPAEMFIMNICIIGNYKKIDVKSLLDIKHSILIFENPINDVIYDISYYKKLIDDDSIYQVKFDKIVINLNDNDTYRIALMLYYELTDNDFNKFVFILNDAISEKQLKHEGLKNIILSDQLVSKYIAQVLIQKSIIKVYNELLHQYGDEFNFLRPDLIDFTKINNFRQFKYIMLQNKIIYIGIIKNGKIKFEEKDINLIKTADKIIVLSKGKI